MDEKVLAHYGVKGMKWGVRRFQNDDGTLTSAGKKRYGEKKEVDPERRERLKKVAIATGTAITVATATAIYLKNKPAVDNFVKQHGSQLLSTIKKSSESAVEKVKDSPTVKAIKDKSAKRTAAKVAADKAYVKKHMPEILKSASKMNRYREYLKSEDVSAAIKKLEESNKLHQLSQDKIRRGANYINAFLAFGTTATTAYGLTKSPLANDLKKKTSNTKGKPKDKG